VNLKKKSNNYIIIPFLKLLFVYNCKSNGILGEVVASDKVVWVTHALKVICD
jgi:hypothetical protein